MSATLRLDLAAARAQGSPSIADAIAASRLVCFPTDTVYGVGGRLSPEVHQAVIAAKGRDAGKPLQVIYSTLNLLEASLDLAPRILDAARRLLPGPFTLLVPYPPGWVFPPAGEVVQPEDERDGSRGRGTRTLGVRVPAWPDAARSLAGLPFPLLASSANPSGGEAPRAVAEVDPGLLGVCDLVLDAGPVGGTASTVIDLSRYASEGGWRILREGSIDEEGVARLLDGAGEESGSR